MLPYTLSCQAATQVPRSVAAAAAVSPGANAVQRSVDGVLPGLPGPTIVDSSFTLGLQNIGQQHSGAAAPASAEAVVQDLAFKSLDDSMQGVVADASQPIVPTQVQDPVTERSSSRSPRRQISLRDGKNEEPPAKKHASGSGNNSRASSVSSARSEGKAQPNTVQHYSKLAGELDAELAKATTALAPAPQQGG